MSEANKPPSEFACILISTGGSRPVMSKPPEFKAARVFVDRVMAELDMPDRELRGTVRRTRCTTNVRHGRQWAAALMCRQIWPLCGHHHMGEEISDDEETE